MSGFSTRFQQLLHLLLPNNLLLNRLNHRAFKVFSIGCGWKNYVRLFDETAYLGIHLALGLTLHHMHGVEVGLARLRRHSVELWLLTVLVEELATSFDVSTAFNVRIDILRITN